MFITNVILVIISIFFTTQSVVAASNPSFVGTHFSGSGNCSQCHDNLTDSEGNDLSIIKNWSTSMMANSTRDPYWRAKVASELHRNPHLSEEINDKCSRCHAPMANEAMKKNNVHLEILGNGMLNAAHSYYDQALDGVSCTACHQISDNDQLGTLAGFSGQYRILSYANPLDRPLFGQYRNPLTNPMINQVSFIPQHSTHMSDSKVCATCHNLKTPFVDRNGVIASTSAETEFPEQMVYTEWNNSAFKQGGSQEKSCQSCHMPKVTDTVKISTRPRNLAARPDFSQHTFLGANTTMMDILNSNRDELSVQATGFDDAIVKTREMLKTSATLDIVSTEIINQQLKVVVKVRNHIGHKFPTSYPSRRAFIHFYVKDAQGKILFESGKMNTNGSIIGNANDINSSTYEPHYEIISSEDQVQIYEPIMQDTDGNVTHTLLRAAAYIKDNRIPPSGFDKAIVPNDVAVKGAAFTDADFNLGQDTLTYLIDVGNETNLAINADLKYQTLSYGHIQDLFKDAEQVPEIATFKRYFDAANIRSELIATVSSQINNEIKTRFSETDSNHSNYFKLAINKAFSIDVSVSYTTQDGTAIAGQDYVMTQGTATIPVGQTSTLIKVDILADNIAESEEDFKLLISNPIGIKFPIGVSEIIASHTIVDDD
jgi:hypothetical protein